MTLHPRVETVANALSALGATGEIRMLPDSARTAQEAATALGIGVGAIANSLIFDAEGAAILILASGAHRVDVQKVSAEQNLPPLKRADADFVSAATGQV
ncbi:MAG TPA: YbaK/EbsC family protein, partial [Aeromicrobium sp.]|nr:YbaK/EbsC family protein [Aeromicrobium sp.]